MDDRTTVRLAASNLLRRDNVSRDIYDDGLTREFRAVRRGTATTWTLRLERRI
jgi:hypothetical protein